MRGTSYFELVQVAPVTAIFCLMSIAATGFYFTGAYDVMPLILNFQYWNEPWRVVTTTWLHGDILHILFNLMWTWQLGTFLEARAGTLKTLFFYILWGGGAGLAQLAMGTPGIGLSGIGYGLVTFLWIAGERNPRYRIIDRNTLLSFAVWFGIALVASWTGLMRVANTAHLMGAVLGAISAYAVAGRQSWQRVVGWALPVIIFAFLFVFAPRIALMIFALTGAL